MNPLPFNRRTFLKRGSVLSAAFAAASVPSALSGELAAPARDPFRSLKVGIASYSLRKFNLAQAITMTGAAGVRHITLKDVHLPLNSTPEQCREAKKQVSAGGLELMGGGVVYLRNNEGEVRAAFDYATNAGMPVLVCSPATEALDLVESAAKAHDIRVAIHNHGPGDDKYPSPLDVYTLVRNRDSRMGICMDVGHTVRLGMDPVAVIGKCAPRLYDFHIKDVTEASPKGACVELGRGVIDLPGVLRALRQAGFSGHLALEYEANPDSPMTGICESFGYLRGALSVLDT